MNLSKYSIAVALLSILSGISISAIAAYYSISGLMLIFSGAAGSIMIMGIALEVGKIIATTWLKVNWKLPSFLIKCYLIVAVLILMCITSMGIFGFLSKSYSDQKLKVSQSQQELIFYDQQLTVKQFELNSQLQRIETAQKSLAQLDEFISESLNRTSEQTTDAAITRTSRLRQSQRSERTALTQEINEAENLILEIRREISKIELERLPYTQNVEKVESELGPISYISKLINQGDSRDQIDRSVTLIILLLVLVFDPLALILLLSGIHSLQSLPNSSNNKGSNKSSPGPSPNTNSHNVTPDPIVNNESVSSFENTDGPVIQPDGSKAWYVDGKKVRTEGASSEAQSLYTQNEEQNVSGIWTNLKNLISRNEYNKISEQKSQETLERLSRA